jgi:hypothetical protein
MPGGFSVDRRAFMVASAATALVRGQGNAVTGQSAINVVERFGFSPDGRTDNYRAFRELARFATERGGGRYFFPKGIYRVAEYRTTKAYQRPTFQAAHPTDITNAVYSNCSGLELIGESASIKLNGRFHRSSALQPDAVVSGLLAATFMPFALRQCTDVLISGFDMDGGVRDMTRDPGVTEAHAYLISLDACQRAVLRDLSLHHSQTDAILLSDDTLLTGLRPGIACRDIRLERVRCENNARGGLAALQVLGLTCIGCSFNGSGRGTGAYGHHAPGFGVDVEPDHRLPKDVDVRTGNLHFENCQFRDNFSALLAAYIHSFQGTLSIINCDSSNRYNAPNHMIICWPGALIDGGTHDLGAGTFWTSWSGQSGGDLVIRHSKFFGSGHYGIFHAHPGNVVTLEQISVTGTHKKPTFGAFPAIQAEPGAGRRNVIRNCRVFLPKARKLPIRATELGATFNHASCEGNSFETDLEPGEGKFLVMYYDCTVTGDEFSGSISAHTS